MKEEAVKERHIIVDRPSWISELGIEVKKNNFFSEFFGVHRTCRMSLMPIESPHPRTSLWLQLDTGYYRSSFRLI